MILRAHQFSVISDSTAQNFNTQFRVKLQCNIKLIFRTSDMQSRLTSKIPFSARAMILTLWLHFVLVFPMKIIGTSTVSGPRANSASKGLWFGTSSGWSKLFPGSIWYLLRERCPQFVVALYQIRRQKTNIYYAQHLLCSKELRLFRTGWFFSDLGKDECARTDVKCKISIASPHNHT
jgi:hypothetical protein